MDTNHIVENTSILLKKFGLNSNTVAEISMKLSISKSTLYSHFYNKAALLDACFEFMRAELDQLLDNLELNNNDSILSLAAIYRTTVDYLTQFDSTFYFDLQKVAPLKAFAQAYFNEYRQNRIAPLIREAEHNNRLLSGSTVDEAVDFFMLFIPYFFTDYKDDAAAIQEHFDAFRRKYFVSTADN